MHCKTLTVTDKDVVRGEGEGASRSKAVLAYMHKS